MLLESFKIPSADFKLAEIAPTCQAVRSPKATSGIDKTMLGAIPSVPKAYCRKKEKLFLLLIVGGRGGDWNV